MNCATAPDPSYFSFEITDILAIAAILVSLYCLYRTNLTSKTIANKTFNMRFFEEIFFTFMTETFPIGIMASIELKDGALVENIDKIPGIIMSMLKKAKYYQYEDKEFYMEFCCILGEIEDKVLALQDEKDITDDLFEEYKFQIDQLGNKFYQLMKKQYSC